MKKFLKNKKKYIPILVIAITIITLLGGTYAIFARIDEAKVSNLYTTGNLQIELDDTSEGLGGVIDVVGVPTSDTDGGNTTPYKFKLTNVGNLSYEFDIKLLSDATYAETHGCANNQLPGNYIKVKLNDETPALLSSLTSNVIKSTIVLKPKEEVIYELRVWLDEDTPNAQRGKHFHGKIVTEGHAIVTEEANHPELADGMIPIKYDSTCNSNVGCWVKADYLNSNNEWYDYNNKMWANAVMVNIAADANVTGSKSRLEYMEAISGTEVLESDILAYYVWIPRYKYKLFNTEFATVEPRSIEIVFEKTTDQVSSGSTNGTYLSHPAFWWDDDSDGVRDAGEELEGIWVGKYEVSSDTTCTAEPYSAVGSGCNNRDYKPRILPGVTSWRGAMTSTYYLASKKIETDTTYLTSVGKNSVDSHMIKNIEWGAVAYLSYSNYGKNSELAVNNNGDTFYTGGGSGNIYKTSISQTTTGNIYGIYDMSGNAWEYVMGVQKDNVSGGGKPMSGWRTTNNYHSGFNGKLYDETTWSDYTGGVNFPDSKYYDLYNYGTSETDYTRSHLGDAIGETVGWTGDYANFVAIKRAWLIRGANYGGESVAGVFAFYRNIGFSDADCSTRLTLINK